MLVVAYATGRASNARQVKDDEPDENGYPGPTGWGLGVRLTTSPHKKFVLKPEKKKGEAKAHPGLQSQQCRVLDTIINLFQCLLTLFHIQPEDGTLCQNMSLNVKWILP